MQSSIAVISIVNDEFLEGPEKFELCFQLTEDHKNRRISQGDPELAMVTITDNQPDGRWGMICYPEYSIVCCLFCI